MSTFWVTLLCRTDTLISKGPQLQAYHLSAAISSFFVLHSRFPLVVCAFSPLIFPVDFTNHLIDHVLLFFHAAFARDYFDIAFS
jgi:hypothetical protein